MQLEEVVASLVQKVEQRYYGKYRGYVIDNADPEKLGRLKVKVPGIFGEQVVVWATPCVPYGGELDRGFLFIPEEHAGVWIEFEEGSLDYPIWVGTFWSKPGGDDKNELPKPNDAEGKELDKVQNPPTRKIIKTKKGHTIQFEDAEDDEEDMVTILEATHGHVVTMNKDGISITDGVNGHTMLMNEENGIKITEGSEGNEISINDKEIKIANKAKSHEVLLGGSGITISDGVNSGNKIDMAQSGVTVEDANGNKVIMGPSGINVGSDSAADFFVLGTQFFTEVSNFLISLGTHTHVGNMGAPTSPPTAPMMLNVPLSEKHKVE